MKSSHVGTARDHGKKTMKKVTFGVLAIASACASRPDAESTAKLSQAYTPPPGTDVTSSGTPIASVTMPTGSANHNEAVIADGVFPPAGSSSFATEYTTYNNTAQSDGWLGYSFASPQTFSGLVWQDGIDTNNNGGWYTSGPFVQVDENGTWTTVSATISPSYVVHDNDFATYVLSFPDVVGTGIRIDGVPGGTGGQSFIGAGEIRVYVDPSDAGLEAGTDATTDAAVDSATEAEAEASVDATQDASPDASEAASEASSSEASSSGGSGSDGNQALPCVTTPPQAAPAPNWNGPVLTPGIWTNISPQTGVTYSLTQPPYGNAWITFDPEVPTTLYTTGDTGGLMVSTNAGTSWSRIQPFDNPTDILVDWANSSHLYVSEGVHGSYLGFWVSEDGGQTWTYPPGFLALGDNDVTDMETDPLDFCHILLSSHSLGNVYESSDGGNSWVTHTNGGAWTVGTKAVHFLHDPAHGQGNASTLLVIDSSATWRSTNDGATWTNVYSVQGTQHGGMEFYYASNGTLYTGGPNYPIRSTDNGLTWTGLTSLGDLSYYAVVGTGTTLFTAVSDGGTNHRTTQSGAQSFFPYETSSETDGLTWTPYVSSQPVYPGGPLMSTIEQTFADGPFRMVYDPSNHVMYSANWDAGLWALRVQ
jgi:photosystem II stability/assembly factor-like uncharacterized protein